MKKKSFMFLPVLFLLTAAVSPNSSTSVHRAEITGAWIAEFQDHKWRGVSESLWITMRANVEKERHGYNFTLDLKDLDGLGISPDHNGKSTVLFELNREAGRFDFEGQFVDNAGSGTFAFTPDDTYISKMGRLGYRSLDQSKILLLAIHDVTTSFVEELSKLGFADLSLDNLLSSAIHGLTPDYIRAIQGIGSFSVSPILRFSDSLFLRFPFLRFPFFNGETGNLSSA